MAIAGVKKNHQKLESGLVSDLLDFLAPQSKEELSPQPQEKLASQPSQEKTGDYRAKALFDFKRRFPYGTMAGRPITKSDFKKACY